MRTPPEEASADDSRSVRRRWNDTSDYFGSTTIRSVTPDPIPEDQSASSRHHVPVLDPSSPQVSPRTTLKDSPVSASRQRRTRAASHNERGQALAMRDQQYTQQSRPRTRTNEGNSSREASPPASLMKSRLRMGSINSLNPSTYVGEEDVVTSIGHISTIPSPFAMPIRPGDSNRNKLAKNPPLQRDPTAPPMQSVSPPPVQSQHSSTPQEHRSDMRKILGLMKSSCGKMEGQLAFRRFETTPWSLSYCNINDETGSLVYEPKSNEAYYRTLIPDLRGCNIKTAWDAESQMPYLDVCPQNSKLRVHLRPHTQDEFDSWFAALLCWQPIRPKGAQNRMTKPQLPPMGGRRLVDSRRHSEVSLLKEPPIIKIGKMIFWDTNVHYSSSGSSKAGKPSLTQQCFGSRRWQQVSSTLRENGEMKLHSEQDMSLLTSVQLSQLSRCAVQRLDPSVLDAEFCLAIYPQYAAAPSSQSFSQPIFLSLESRVLYEVWLVLLRAFTIPQLYGPKPALLDDMSSSSSPSRPPSHLTTTDMFRMERSLVMRIVEARLVQPVSPRASEHNIQPFPESRNGFKDNGGYYTEILLDGETRAKSVVKSDSKAQNLWYGDNYEFTDLPAAVSVASILLKKRPPNQGNAEQTMREESKKMHKALNGAGAGGHGSTGVSFDQTCGQVDIFLDDLDVGKEVEKWWPLVNQYGQGVGEVYAKIAADESVILMARDYQPLSEILHRFSNGLTLQIASSMPVAELKRLSDCLLNIFQVSGTASDWIMSLAEEEIDGTFKEAPVSHIRFNSRRMSANDNNEGVTFPSGPDRELVVRDMGKSATAEANILFRGNTILTKSLDIHMKRLGKEYLEETLGDKLKEIADKDPDCEVDPNKVTNSADLERNWRRLLHYTQECWKCIANSAQKCPTELRYIFRHIRACAEDRYGDFLRTVKYSSVSGFLFLRFFCPAILNPKLFGLLNDHPQADARRTFTLIAKSLQGLANLSKFGAKEHWMEPMNTFMTSYRTEFKTFLDVICSVPSSNIPVIIPPSYSTPLTILSRLPPTSREGFPSLPYLIDHAKSFASLVNLWLEHCSGMEANGDLGKFHELCVQLRHRTEECLVRAERAERPKSGHSFVWEEVVEQIETSSSAPAAADDSSRRSITATSLHNRGESTGKASSISTRSITAPDSPVPMRGLRGPGRQLSLEILPTSRTLVRDVGRQASHNAQDNASPASAATSPHAASESGFEFDDGGRRSGTVTPSSNPRNYPYGYGSTKQFTFSSDAARREKQREKDRSRKESGHVKLAKSSGSRNWLLSEAAPVDKVETAEGSSWNGEPMYVEDPHAVQDVSGDGSVHRRVDSHERHLLQERASRMDPGERQSSTPKAREPRRDWAADERAKREERTLGITMAHASSSSPRHISGGRGNHSSTARRDFHSSTNSSAGEEEEDEEEGATALPRIAQRDLSTSKDRERHLLERMIFKKRRG